MADFNPSEFGLRPVEVSPEEQATLTDASAPRGLDTEGLRPAAMENLTDDELVNMAVESRGKFDPLQYFYANRDRLYANPEAVEKFKAVHGRLVERGFEFSDLPVFHQISQAAEAVAQGKPGEAFKQGVEAGKEVVLPAWHFVKGVAKQGWNYASALSPNFMAYRVLTGKAPFGPEEQRKIVENWAGTEQAVTGLSEQAQRLAGKVAAPLRATPLTEKEKDAAFWSAVGKLETQEEISRGHGGFLGSPLVGKYVVSGLEEQGKPVRPEEVGELAAGDPFSLWAFGKVFHGLSRATPAPVRAAVQRAEDVATQGAVAATGRAISATGRALEAAGPTGRAAAQALPVVGLAGGAVKGGPIGALAGLKGGELAKASVQKYASRAQTFGQSLTKFGQDLRTGAPLGDYGQLFRDVIQAAPKFAAEVGKGAALDISLAAATAETPGETAQAATLGTVFGLGRGLGRGFKQVVSGQIVTPRPWAPISVVEPASGQLPAVERIHQQGYEAAAPGIKLRVNGIRSMLRRLGATQDFYYTPTVEGMTRALVELGFNPAEAASMAQSQGMFVGRPPRGGNRVVLVREMDAAPHESFHPMQDVLGETGNRAVDEAVRNSYTPQQWEAYGSDLAARHLGITTEELAQRRLDWREVLLDVTGKGQQAAAEQVLRDAAEMLGEPIDSPRVIQAARDIFTQAVENNGWRQILKKADRVAAADQYIARELAADAWDPVLQNLGPSLQSSNTAVATMARVAAALASALGAEPLAERRTAEGMPLSTKLVDAVTEAARGLEPARVEPTAAPRPEVGAPPAALARGGEPVTEEQRQQAAQEAREIATRAPDQPLPGQQQSQREMLGVIAEGIAGRTAVMSDYRSAQGIPSGDPVAELLIRRAEVEAARNIPEDQRPLMRKLFFPYRAEIRKGGKIQSLGYVPEVVASNAIRWTKALSQLAVREPNNPELARVPYELDIQAGEFTPDGWRQFIQDLQTYGGNQIRGFTGAGGRLQVQDVTLAPGTLRRSGYFAPPETGAPVTLDPAKMDFLNLVHSIRPPVSPRMQGTRIPGNVAAVEVSEATMPGRFPAPEGRTPALVEPVRPSTPGGVRRPFRGAAAEAAGVVPAGGERPIQETNPLRMRLEKELQRANIPIPQTLEAMQRLNLEHFASATLEPNAPRTVGANILTLSAGFKAPERGGEEQRIRLYRGQPGEGAPAGVWWTANPQKAASFAAGGQVTSVEVPLSVALEGFQRARQQGQGGDTFVLPAEYSREGAPVRAEAPVFDIGFKVQKGEEKPLAQLHGSVWMDPNGAVIKIEDHTHRQWATRNRVKLGIPSNEDVMEGMFKRGWRRVVMLPDYNVIAVEGGPLRGGQRVTVEDAAFETNSGVVDGRGDIIMKAPRPEEVPPGLRTSVEFKVSDDPRAVKEAALRWPDGTMVTGRTHMQAAMNAPKDINFAEDGFVTNSGEFLTREEAFVRAAEVQQLPEGRELEATVPVGGARDVLESIRFNRLRQFKVDKEEPRAIRSAALRLPNGEILEGPSHMSAWLRGEKENRIPADVLAKIESGEPADMEYGFVTNENKFLDAVEAANRAVELGQISEKARGDFIELESGLFRRERQFKAPTREEFDQIDKLPPLEFAKRFTEGGLLQDTAMRIGAEIGPSIIPEAEAAKAKLPGLRRVAMAAQDLDTAYALANKSQFYDEVIKGARGEKAPVAFKVERERQFKPKKESYGETQDRIWKSAVPRDFFIRPDGSILRGEKSRMQMHDEIAQEELARLSSKGIEVSESDTPAQTLLKLGYLRGERIDDHSFFASGEQQPTRAQERTVRNSALEEQMEPFSEGSPGRPETYRPFFGEYLIQEKTQEPRQFKAAPQLERDRRVLDAPEGAFTRAANLLINDPISMERDVSKIDEYSYVHRTGGGTRNAGYGKLSGQEGQRQALLDAAKALDARDFSPFGQEEASARFEAGVRQQAADLLIRTISEEVTPADQIAAASAMAGTEETISRIREARQGLTGAVERARRVSERVAEELPGTAQFKAAKRQPEEISAMRAASRRYGTPLIFADEAVERGEYWMTPEGLLAKLKPGQMHAEWASDYYKRMRKEDVSIDDAAEALVAEGWARVVVDRDNVYVTREIEGRDLGLEGGLEFGALDLANKFKRPVVDSQEELLVGEEFIPSGEAQFKAAKAGQKRRANWKFPAKAVVGFKNGWILPSGEPEQIGGMQHLDWLYTNRDMLQKRYGLEGIPQYKGRDIPGAREKAIEKGLTRFAYNLNTGTLVIESSLKTWGKQKENVRELISRNIEDIDNISISLLDPRAPEGVVDQRFVRLFNFDDVDKMDHIPFMQETPKLPEVEAPVRQESEVTRTRRMLEALEAAETERPWMEREREVGGRQFKVEKEKTKVLPRGAEEIPVQDALEAGRKIYEATGEWSKARTAQNKAWEALQQARQNADREGTEEARIAAFDATGEWSKALTAESKAWEILAQLRQSSERQFKAEKAEDQRTLFSASLFFGPEVSRIQGAKSGEGQTFDVSGDAWSAPKGEKVDIVTLASVNIPRGELTPERIRQELEPYRAQLESRDLVAGVFNFDGPEGKPMTSLDVNVAVPQKYRENSVAFAKDNDQISIFDLDKFEEVKTGGAGNTRLKTPEQIAVAAPKIRRGEEVDVPRILNKYPTLPGTDQPSRPYDKAAIANMTLAELRDHFPEAAVPRRADEKVPSNIIKAPLLKGAKTEEEKVRRYADRLVEDAKKFEGHPVFEAGKRWYSEFAPALKKEFGEWAPKFTQLLAATSPQTNPELNFRYAYEALRQWQDGKFEPIVSKYQEGLDIINRDQWMDWLQKEVEAGNIKQLPAKPSAATFLAEWINKYDLLPTRAGGQLFGTHGRAILKVLTDTWLDENAGLKTQQFLKNLLAEEHGATIDVWANRTMRRLGYEGFTPRWRLLPRNETAVSDPDFVFSQKVFANAAERMGMLPDALQGAMWFAEKLLWHRNGWGKLELGSYSSEMGKLPKLEKRVQAEREGKAVVEPRETYEEE